MAGESVRAPSVALYGVSIQDALASGDVNRLSAIRDEALDFLANAAEVRKLLPELEQAIRGLGGPIRVLYGQALEDARASGDQAQLARLRAEVVYYRGLLA